MKREIILITAVIMLGISFLSGLWWLSTYAACAAVEHTSGYEICGKEVQHG